jgi:hypothetical protein
MLVSFFDSVIQLGAVGDAPTIQFQSLKRVTPFFRKGRNPLTGETLEIRGPSRWPEKTTQLDPITQLTALMPESQEFDVSVFGQTRPPIPPLPIQFGDEYYLTVSGNVRSQTVSLSDLHSDATTHRFGQDCNDSETIGRYSDPQTLECIEVPGAAFWLEFELGKYLFPFIENGNLNILNSCYLDVAVASFGIEFKQGCRWG